MQTIQHPPVTDTGAGLANLNPCALTDRELRRYASLVSPDKLPIEWQREIFRRYLDKSSV